MAKSDDKNLQMKSRYLVLSLFHEGSTRKIGYLTGVPYPPSALISSSHVLRTTLNQKYEFKNESGIDFLFRNGSVPDNNVRELARRLQYNKVAYVNVWESERRVDIELDAERSLMGMNSIRGIEKDLPFSLATFETVTFEYDGKKFSRLRMTFDFDGGK